MIQYIPTMRFKSGEGNCLSNIPIEVKRHIAPHLIVPPLKERTAASSLFDSVDDLPNSVCRNIQRYWPHGLCFLNLNYLAEEMDTESQQRLYRIVRDVNPNVVPILTHEQLKDDLVRAIVTDTTPKLGLMIGFEDIDTDNLVSTITKIGRSPEEVFVFVDYGGAILDPEIASGSVAHSLDVIGQSAAWLRIVPVWSSYPSKNPAEPGQTLEIPRHEQALFSAAMDETVVPRDRFCYGDFGPDSDKIDFQVKPTGARAIAHLRYSTADSSTIVSRGAKGKSWHEAIHNICRTLASRHDFFGRSFSYADRRIHEVANGIASTGGPSDWREWNMAHHICMVVSDLQRELGLPAVETRQLEESEQLTLV